MALTGRPPHLPQNLNRLRTSRVQNPHLPPSRNPRNQQKILITRSRLKPRRTKPGLLRPLLLHCENSRAKSAWTCEKSTALTLAEESRWATFGNTSKSSNASPPAPNPLQPRPQRLRNRRPNKLIFRNGDL